MFGGEGETRTPAPVSRPTPLAGAPRHQLEYISVSVNVFKRLSCIQTKFWRRGWDSNPRLSRVTGFQDQLLKPLGHLSFWLRVTLYHSKMTTSSQKPKRLARFRLDLRQFLSLFLTYKTFFKKSLDKPMSIRYNKLRREAIRCYSSVGRAHPW